MVVLGFCHDTTFALDELLLLLALFRVQSVGRSLQRFSHHFVSRLENCFSYSSPSSRARSNNSKLSKMPKGKNNNNNKNARVYMCLSFESSGSLPKPNAFAPLRQERRNGRDRSLWEESSLPSSIQSVIVAAAAADPSK